MNIWSSCSIVPKCQSSVFVKSNSNGIDICHYASYIRRSTETTYQLSITPIPFLQQNNQFNIKLSCKLVIQKIMSQFENTGNNYHKKAS